MLFLKRLRLT